MRETKYDKIGLGYNATRQADTYLASRMLHYLAPQPGQRFLDIGCGTGNYTSIFMNKGLDFIGIDPSDQMLSAARDKNPKGKWMQARAEHTGLSSESMDGIIGSLTIHHWQNLELAFNELNRILKPTGQLILFTSTPDQMKGYWLNTYFPKMLQDSMDQMPSLELVTSALHQSGFQITETEKYFVTAELTDLFLYSGKHRPHLYLDAQVRQGISSFSDLSNAEEINAGLAQLALDIESDKIKEVMDSDEYESGDYLFVIAQKK
ncbi:MAG: class I SAM-dependent methyltransferase [Reichenbachiella sp.]|uniref:class I SAM-dependent methyltransferase n=1 Tax=Reichenbachiella sp. TaxID=2184521 RepID=UPI003263D1DC